MGCACSSSARQQSAAAAAHDGGAVQPRASSQGSSSALVNAFLGAMTPALQHGIGSSIVNWDEAGAVLMHSDEWSLHVRHCGDAEGGGGGPVRIATGNFSCSCCSCEPCSGWPLANLKRGAGCPPRPSVQSRPHHPL